MKTNLKPLLIAVILLLCSKGFSQKFTIRVSNINRSYIVRLPENYDDQLQLPMHIFLHGGGFTIEDAEDTYGFTEHADTSGYILVYPQGLNNNWSRENDYEFINVLIDELTSDYKVNADRVYVSGHSAGCVLVNLLACGLSHKIAAFGDISGFMTTSYSSYYNPVQPVPFLKIHGTGDTEISYDGSSTFPSADSAVMFWRYHNSSGNPISTDTLPNLNTSDNSYVIKNKYGEGRSEVVFYKIINGGHDSPDWAGNNEMGNTNRDINAPEVLWDFFKNHKLGGVKISYIANCGFLVESSKNKVLIDALFTEGFGLFPVPSESLKNNMVNGTAPFNNVDLHLITHNHADHIDNGLVASQLVNNHGLHLIGPKSVETALRANSNYNLIENRIIEITPTINSSDNYEFPQIPVKVFRMHHLTSADIENNAYLFEIAGVKILHIGDYTGDVLSDLETFNLKDEDIDVAFVNYGCYFQGEAIKNAVRVGINAKHTILYHMSNENLNEVLSLCDTTADVSAFRSELEYKHFYPESYKKGNTAPYISREIDDYSFQTSDTFAFTIGNDIFMDDDHMDELTLSVKFSDTGSLLENLTFYQQTNTFSGNNIGVGQFSIEVTATDMAGEKVSDVFMLTISESSTNDNIEAEQKYFVYPNPAKEIIQVHSDASLVENTTYQLINTNGKIIKYGLLEANNIDVSGITKGLYILSLISESGIRNTKVLID